MNVGRNPLGYYRLNQDLRPGCTRIREDVRPGCTRIREDVPGFVDWFLAAPMAV
jgi:hypothetical protein